MKFMGSKRWMLANGLGEAIRGEIGGAARFVDLFTGTGQVAAHVAGSFGVPVEAHDLQSFSVALASAVIARTRPVDPAAIWADWFARAKAFIGRTRPPPLVSPLTRGGVSRQREWCGAQSWSFARAYGGHYFSAEQSLWLHALRATLPGREPARTVALAALIQAASRCAASPGHTAQPLQPTPAARRFLEEAWRRDAAAQALRALEGLAGRCARVKGRASSADANTAARGARPGDLAFVDPPYSGVHYSRFYHVLETLARGYCGEVSGVGRYPQPEERPRSRYSLRGESADALGELLLMLATAEARVILTFPERACSNGLSGEIVCEVASEFFSIERRCVESRFSTLGGRGGKRGARQAARELILLLRPRASRPRRLAPGGGARR